MTDGILSIQSHVAYGHVGNSAAVFPLQRLGYEVWPVNTVLFSNHTGYGQWRGRAVELAWVQEVLQGIEERGAFARVRALLSGYLGSADLGEAVVDTLRRVRVRRPDAIYACDPVMGDKGRGFFVRPGIPEMFRDRVLPLADIVTPNQFELGWLSGVEITDLSTALLAAATVRARGPKLVVCTSLELRPGELAVLAHAEAGSWLVTTPELPVSLNGTGDAFTALFLGYWLRDHDPASALAAATSAMFGLIQATHRAGSRELLLVAAQAELVDPERRFEVRKIA